MTKELKQLREALRRVKYEAVSLADAQVIALEALTAAQPAQAGERTGYSAPKGRYVPPVLFNPYSGEPRDARDIHSDPHGVLIVPPGADLVASLPTQPAAQATPEPQWETSPKDGEQWETTPKAPTPEPVARSRECTEPMCACMGGPCAECPEGEREKEIADLRTSRDFYKRRADALQQAQSHMRDPERTMVCDILANGALLVPAGDRYAATPEPVGEVALLVAEILSLADDYAEAEAKAGGLAGCGGDIGEQHELDEDAAYIKGRLTDAVGQLADISTHPAPGVPDGEPTVNWFGTHFTYKNQPCDNVTAWRFGEAARSAKPGGDLIDHGLSLLHELEARGYGIFALAAAQAKGGDHG